MINRLSTPAGAPLPSHEQYATSSQRQKLRTDSHIIPNASKVEVKREMQEIVRAMTAYIVTR